MIVAPDSQHRISQMEMTRGDTALVITDPQNDFLSPEGVTGTSSARVSKTTGPSNTSSSIASPHKVYGPESNDLALQLRKRGIDKVIVAGMSANLCVESHLRELLEQGFEVGVVRDATAAAQHPDLGDGYATAVTNFGFIANAVLTTDQAVAALGSA